MKPSRLVTKCRTRAGISKRELARRSGISNQYVCDIEAGEKQPTLETLGKIVKACGGKLVVEAKFK